MSRTPTTSQKTAIYTRDRSVLLSAAAGSGKTFTLTERIIDSLLDENSPADLSRMLVVTFTKDATLELHSRISAALNSALADHPENSRLSRQLATIGSARISTIDSFFLDVVKSDFQNVTLEDGSPLPGDFRLADSTELDSLRIDVMNSVIDDWFSKPGRDDFSRFAGNFVTGKGDGNLVKILIQYAQMLDNVKNPIEFTYDAAAKLKDSVGVDFFETPFGKIIKEHVRADVTYLHDIAAGIADSFTEGTRTKYGDKIDYYITLTESLLTVLDGVNAYYNMREALADVSIPSSARKGDKDDETEYLTENVLHTRFKASAKSDKTYKTLYFTFDDGQISAFAECLAENVEVLAAVMGDFRRAYQHEKLIRRVCEFSDITRFAHSLLVNPDGTPTAKALEYRARFDAVYVDEYQDLNSVQDEIFTAIAPPDKRFTVGDIKQSIYSFRGAEPGVFGRMRDSLPAINTPEAENAVAVSHFMSENFRCDRNVIDFVNLVCDHTFAKVGGEVNYRDEDKLICGKENPGNEPVRLGFFANAPTESLYVAKEIKRLIGNEKKNDGTPIIPGDITILVRKSTKIHDIVRALDKEGIKSVSIGVEQLFETPEIRLVLSLFRVFNDPDDDVSLAAAVMSPFWNFTMNDLLLVRRATDTSYSLFEAFENYAAITPSSPLSEKCAAFIGEVDRLRRDAARMSVDRFVDMIYHKFGVTSLCYKEDSRNFRPKEQVTANLRAFYGYARQYSESQSGGLCGFISFIDRIITNKTKVDTPTGFASDDTVKIMTIHKSKGLEFPVVFVCGCGGDVKPQRDDPRHDKIDVMSYSVENGVAMKLVDETGYTRTETPFHQAINLAQDAKSVEEEMRVLYVAMTRARERLYLTGSTKKKFDNALAAAHYLHRFECRFSAMNADSYSEWLLAATVSSVPCFKFESAPEEAPDEILPEEEADENAENIDAIVPDEKTAKLVYDRINYKYGYSASLKLPAKLSVSKLYPGILDDDGSDSLDGGKIPELRDAPAFLSGNEKAKASDKGTATHVFLQFCDFARAEKSVTDELARLVAEKFIPENTAKLVSVKQLENFFASDFYDRIKRASDIRREQRFNLFMPASEFTKDETLVRELENDNLLVQGVIDICFTEKDGGVVLCDYKTDYLTREELADESLAAKKLIERHKTQLSYYACAVRQMRGENTNLKVCIYSLPLGKAVYLNENDLVIEKQ